MYRCIVMLSIMIENIYKKCEFHAVFGTKKDINELLSNHWKEYQHVINHDE